MCFWFQRYKIAAFSIVIIFKSTPFLNQLFHPFLKTSNELISSLTRAAELNV